MINTPYSFRPQMPFDYPMHNTQIFEEFFYERFVSNSVDLKFTYLPIFWTSLYVRRDYGKGDISDIQNYLNSLDRSKKYFTLIQYDEGILNDISFLDICIFSLAQGKKFDYILPTPCLPRPNINKNRDRDIFCSSFGRYKGVYNHPLHDKLICKLEKPKYLISKKIDQNAYYDFLERSLFFICANGYSPTTFKICECFQHGTIPVFLYDKKWIPFENDIDFERACVMISENNIDDIDSILSNISSEKIQDMREYGNYIYENYYKYQSLYDKVIEILKK